MEPESSLAKVSLDGLGLLEGVTLLGAGLLAELEVLDEPVALLSHAATLPANIVDFGGCDSSIM